MWVSKKEWDGVLGRLSALEEATVLEKGTGVHDTKYTMFGAFKTERVLKIPLERVVRHLMGLAKVELRVNTGRDAIAPHLVIERKKSNG